VIVGVAAISARAALTVRVKDVVLVTPAPVDVTIIGKLPPGVDPLVLIVNIDEQVGVQVGAEKEAVAPEGNPEAEKETV